MVKRDRSMFGFPWPPARKKAFQIVAERVPDRKNQKGNASELARNILEDFMFSVLGKKEAETLGILSPYDKEPPSPGLLEYALREYKQHRGRLIDGSVSDTVVDAEQRNEEGIVKSLQSRKRNLTKAS